MNHLTDNRCERSNPKRRVLGNSHVMFPFDLSRKPEVAAGLSGYLVSETTEPFR